MSTRHSHLFRCRLKWDSLVYDFPQAHVRSESPVSNVVIVGSPKASKIPEWSDMCAFWLNFAQAEGYSAKIVQKRVDPDEPSYVVSGADGDESPKENQESIFDEEEEEDVYRRGPVKKQPGPVLHTSVILSVSCTQPRTCARSRWIRLLPGANSPRDVEPIEPFQPEAVPEDESGAEYFSAGRTGGREYRLERPEETGARGNQSKARDDITVKGAAGFRSVRTCAISNPVKGEVMAVGPVTGLVEISGRIKLTIDLMLGYWSDGTVENVCFAGLDNDTVEPEPP
ncbi:hypothetical protein DFH08DRAFT_1027079 [Mycena albidolilacea]|uniref:Uncharacterized protein n=1 Tax=Mycena albidolilacea TaxID=1033008 RepID=A0AAD6ZJM2_9AGAR|nr:hypothetical protein DFH08DRAFT_1027079 [Mycena albidolilacea]